MEILARSAVTGEHLITVHVACDARCEDLCGSIAKEMGLDNRCKAFFGGVPLDGDMLVSASGLHNGDTVDVIFESWPDVLTASDDRTARLWTITASGASSNILMHTESLSYAAISKNGQLVTASSRSVSIWDLNGKCQNDFELPHVKAVAFANVLAEDGSEIEQQAMALTHEPGSRMAKTWDVKSGKLQSTLVGCSGATYAASFYEDIAVLGSWDGAVVAWRNVLCGGVHETFFEVAVREAVSATAIDSSSELLLIGLRSGLATTWNLGTGELKHTFLGHSCTVRCVAFAPDKQKIAIGSEDQSITLWSLSSGHSLGQLAGHLGYIYCVVFLPCSSVLMSSSADGTVKLWDASNAQCLRTLRGHCGPIRFVVLST